MKFLSIVGIVASLFFAIVRISPAFGQTLTETTQSIVAPDGVTRWFKVFTPSNLDSPAKVVLVLHGGSLDYDQTDANSQYEWREIATEQGILVVYPNGTSTAGVTDGSDQHWNDCRADAGDNDVTANDVGFINGMLDWVEGHYNVDPRRVYAVGTSNGGMMSYRLAREVSDRGESLPMSLLVGTSKDPDTGTKQIDLQKCRQYIDHSVDKVITLASVG